MNLVAGALLVCFALAVASFDVRSRRIPNWLTVGGAAVGLVFGWASGSAGLTSAMLGLGVALAVGFVLHLLKALGAGDAKFMAAIGAWSGLERLPMAYLAMLAGGAVFALVWAMRQRMLRATLVSTSAMLGAAASGGGPVPPMIGGTAAGKFPYAVGLGLGAIAWWFWAGGVLP